MKTVAAILLGFLLMATIGIVSNECLYETELKPGDQYYVYNSNYPDRDKNEQTCEWIARSATGVNLTCTQFDIGPVTPDCRNNYMVINGSGSPPGIYCGQGNFTFISNSSVTSIRLQLDWTGSAKFLCSLVALRPTKCRCGWKKLTRIVGGEETGVNEYPMMVGLLEFTEDGQERFLCGGTIISNRYILTAAHCVVKRNIESVILLIGGHNITVGNKSNVAKYFKVEKFIIHPAYDRSNNQNDIAIVKTADYISFSMEVGPACLPFEHSCDSFVGSKVIALGWGLLEFTGRQPTTLQQTQLYVYPHSKCMEEVGAPEKTICTIGNRTDTCQMDSGGPIMFMDAYTEDLTLIAVIAWGISCASGYPSVNIKVGSYLEWITSETPDADYCKQE
ncbi:hypothetical protein KM043_003147 [Ampulex compressa]|nr:hypothetical protein KM043_003147 [Ampulex compressa]